MIKNVEVHYRNNFSGHVVIVDGFHGNGTNCAGNKALLMRDTVEMLMRYAKAG